MRKRFTIAGLMALVFFVAIGFAALKSASATWAGLISMVATGMLLLAVLGAAIRRDEARAYFAGFALFGSAYYLACSAPWFAREVGPYLPTSRMLDEAYARSHKMPMHPSVGTSSERIEFWDYQNRGYIKLNPYSYWVEGRDHFRRSGHALAAMVFGFIGGLIGRGLHRGQVATERSED